MDENKKIVKTSKPATKAKAPDHSAPIAKLQEQVKELQELLALVARDSGQSGHFDGKSIKIPPVELTHKYQGNN